MYSIVLVAPINDSNPQKTQTHKTHKNTNPLKTHKKHKPPQNPEKRTALATLFYVLFNTTGNTLMGIE
jgi:hypothetical protein